MAPKRKAAAKAAVQTAKVSGKKASSAPAVAKKGKTVAAKKVTPPASRVSAAKTPLGKRSSKRSTNKAATTTTNDDNSVDFTQLTVAQLKAECTKNGLDTSGVKAALIKRLHDHVQNGEEEEEPPAKLQKQSTIQKALATMKASLTADSKKQNKTRVGKVDPHCSLPNAVVVDDYDCMLNQTNIGFNNNKYYVIQLLKSFNVYYTFNRWGRVGEPGQQATKGHADLNKAIKDFEKKFNDKTKNDWADRDNFEPVQGKYTLIDMGNEEEDQSGGGQTVQRVCDTGTLAVYKPCKLDVTTQVLVKLVFDNDMFKEALIKLEIDVKKMPLGKLSKNQIVKGFEVLDDIKQCFDGKSSAYKKLEELSSKFYTVIPHDFGRQRPPIINSQELLRTKLDLLITLSDIEMAQDMLKHREEAMTTTKGELPDHPLDTNYKLLQCLIDLVKVSDKEYKVIEKYVQSTAGYRIKKLVNVWRMDRKGEAERVKPHDKIGNRKLLWHGTNVAVVAAIMKSGLRIMPHSGGRVGRGIYFASENSKSAGYVQTSKNVGIMFLNEVILGKEHYIIKDDCSLTKPPAGFDSIVARGQTEPDPKLDTQITLGGKTVIVPQGPPVAQTGFKTSSFSQSEYLVYQENQVRMRYLLQFQMDY